MLIRIPLRGPAGEPVDFARTVRSHGCTSLPPATHLARDRYDVVLRIDGAPRAVSMRPGGADLVIETAGRASKRIAGELESIARRMFRLDTDLSDFYDLAGSDEQLAWAIRGAGRMMASPSVFEDVVKTICTTNCAWSATVRMVTALVERLGEGAFPEPQAMAKAPLSFYRDAARAGYRGPYLKRFAQEVAAGRLDLEGLLPERGLQDEEVEERLQAIEGVGPYASAHIMMLLGRHRRLVLDSWTRPTYAKLVGKKKVADRTIERRFRRFKRYAGLAFWLRVTEDWV